MNWKSYEETVKCIYEQLGRSANIKILGWGAACKVSGKSGVKHQVDVLTSHSDGIHSYRTAIECKYWNDKVKKDTIVKLFEILEDAQIEKGVVVSKSGFTPDAVALARYKNISIVELREPVDDDWKGRIKDIHICINMSIPRIYDYELVQERTKNSNKSKSKQFHVLTSDVFFHTPDGNSMSIHELTNSEISADKTAKKGEEKAYSVPFPIGTTLSFPTTEARVSVKEIRFKVCYSTITRKIEIRGTDYVSMIMSSIFEKKRFVISPYGEIRESDPLP